MNDIRKNQIRADGLNQNKRAIFGRAIGCLSWSLIPGVWPLLSACLLLSGCSTTSETFDCKADKGVGCKSISEVNQLVEQGVVGADVSGKGGSVSIMPPPAPVITTGSLGGNISDVLLMDGGQVRRVSEEHLRVWIAPFQDDQGNLHEGSVIHTVLKPGYWQLQGG